jgi:DNA-directed RNA polymerase specialized sigma24 family protein
MKTTNPRFNRLVARYYPAVFHLAAAFSKSPAEAVALTRRTFERAAQQLPRFRSADEVTFLLLTSLGAIAAPKAT